MDVNPDMLSPNEPCRSLTPHALPVQDRYYAEKLEVDPSDPQQIRRAAIEFVRGIHWVLAYYYRGVASWDWFFPYHFAPMCSDLTATAEVPSQFELGEPFLPYWQLLAVLPAGSKDLLPKPYQVGAWRLPLGWGGESDHAAFRP